MKTTTTVALLAGGAALAYVAYGKKPARFLGDKAEIGDAVAVPIGLDPAIASTPVTFGPIPPNATKYVFTVDAAGPDLLTGQAQGLVLALPGGGEQFVLFPNQAFLNQTHLMLRAQRRDVVGVVHAGRPVLFP